MTEREKVIKGLECAIDPEHNGFKNCHTCAYRKDVDHLQYVCDGDRCIMDALTLLKAQEPRVLTFDEVKKHYNLPPVFTDDLEMQEDYYQDIQPLYFEFPNSCAWDIHWRGSNKVRTYLDKWGDRYNKTWRCWTSRPTDEQREETPWTQTNGL